MLPQPYIPVFEIYHTMHALLQRHLRVNTCGKMSMGVMLCVQNGDCTEMETIILVKDGKI